MSITAKTEVFKKQEEQEQAQALDKSTVSNDFQNYVRTTDDEQLDQGKIKHFLDNADPASSEAFIYRMKEEADEHLGKGDEDAINSKYFSRLVPLFEEYEAKQDFAGQGYFKHLERKRNQDFNTEWQKRKKAIHDPVFLDGKKLEGVKDKYQARVANAMYLSDVLGVPFEQVNGSYEIYRAQMASSLEIEPTDQALFNRIQSDFKTQKSEDDKINDLVSLAMKKSLKGKDVEWSDDLAFIASADTEEEKQRYMRIMRSAERGFYREYGNVLPDAESYVSDVIEGENDETFLIDDKDKARKSRMNATLEKVSKMSKEDREKFLYVVYQIGESNQSSSDSMSENFSKSLSRADDSLQAGGDKFLTDLFGGLEGDDLAKQQLRNDLLNINNVVRKLDPIKENWINDKIEQGLYDATGSMPRMLLAASGFGTAVNMGVYGADNDDILRRSHPEMSEEDRHAISYTAGIAQGAIERMQFKTLFKGAPKTSALFQKLGANGAVASFLGRWTVAAGKEYVQERVQDAMLPLTQKIASKLSEDIPDVKEEAWNKAMQIYDERTLFAVLPLAMLGAGGSTVMDKVGAESFRKHLANEDQLRLSGLTREEAGVIMSMNGKGSINSHKEFQKLMEGKTDEQKQQASKEALEDGAYDRVVESQVMENGTDVEKKAYTEAKQAFDELAEKQRRINGDIRNTEDGRVEVVFPENHKRVNEYFESEEDAHQAYLGATEQFDRQQSAEIEAKQAQIEELRSSGIKSVEDANKAVAEHLADAHEGGETKFIDKDHGLKQKQAKGEISMEDAMDAIRVANIHNTSGTEITLDNAKIKGENQLRKNAKGYINKIYRGADISTVFHESSEGYLKSLIENDGYTYEWFAKHMGDYQRATGDILARNINSFTEREVIEGWSKLAEAHTYNHSESSLFPPAIRAILSAFKKYFKHTITTAKNLLQLKQDGKLDGEFETHLNKAVGLDEDTIQHNQQKKYEAEIMEEMLDPEMELSNVMKGRIPRPVELAENETLKGEVKNLWDNLSKYDRNGRKQAQKASSFFADKGSGITLHNALEYAREAGFNFETESELLDAVQSSLVDDVKSYPDMEQIENGLSFSIGEAASFSIASTDVDAHKQAYESGDTEKAQYLVNKAAEQAGYMTEIYHGTTHKFDKFEGAERGNVEGHFGATNYFTNERADAEGNYLENGQDLTNRIEQRKEKLESELEFLDETDLESFKQDHGIDESITEFDEVAELVAEAELKGGDNIILNLVGKFSNPVTIDAREGTGTFIEFREELSEDALTDAKDELIDEGEFDEGEIDDYQWMIEERAQENNSDEDSKLHEAIYQALNDSGVYDLDEALNEVIESLQEYEFEGGNAYDIDQSIRQSEATSYLEDGEGNLVSSEFIGNLFHALGYDSIILENADAQFENMDMEYGTTHYHTIESSKVKLSDPFTFDSDGNLIPLDQRFDETRGEISFSLGAPVASLTGNEFQKIEGVKLDEQVTAYLIKEGKQVVNHPEVGEIVIDKEGFKSSISKGLGRKKSATFMALPDVLEKGEVVEESENWKGRGYDTVVLAAPVEIAEEEHVVFAIVNKKGVKDPKGKNKYHVHEVVTVSRKADGSFQVPNLPRRKNSTEPSDIERVAQKFFESKQNQGDSFSITPSDDPLISKIRKLIRDPETKATVFKVMATRLSKLKASQNAKLTKRLFDGEGEVSSHEELLDSIAQLDAIIAVLPREVRGQIGGYKKLAELKTVKGRTNYLTRRMEHVDDALEKYMVKSYKEAIKKMFDRSKPKSKNKASDAGQSKIGSVGHLIAEAAESASAMNPDQAELRAAEIRREIENPEPEEEQELEDRAYVTEMFADMNNADSQRLDQLLGILQANWDEGRAEWRKVLEERKDWKESIIEKARKAFGVSKKNDAQTTSKTGKTDETWKQYAKEGLNFYQITDLMREGDKSESDSIWKEMADDWRRADNQNENLNLEHKEEMKSVLSQIFGFSRNKQAQVQDRLRSLSKQVKQAKVTKTQEYELEIAANAEDLYAAEKAYDAGEEIEIRGNSISREEYQELSIGWQDAVASGFNPEASKLFRHTLIRNEGERSSVGEMSQLDMLKDWLSVQQKDLKTKYEKNGYDEQYRAELERALEDDVKELGLWMQGKLRDDQEIQQALHRQEYGLALKLIENYFPAVFEHGGKQSGTTLTMDGIEIGQSSTRPSAHKLRVNHNSRPKKQNAIAVFNGHVMQRNFWQTHAEVMRKWAGVIRDKNMQDYILRAKGQTALNMVNRWLNDTENQGGDVARAQIETDNLWRSLGQGMALGILGGRISTIFKNITAGTNVILGTNFKDLVRGFSPEIRNDVKELYESDTFQRRLKMGSTVAARYALESSASGHIIPATLKRAAEYPVQGINLADTLSNLTFALAYRSKIVELQKQGINEVEAKEQALDHVDDLVARFAQPTSRLSKSLWENSRSPEATFMVMFMSEARKVIAINMMAIRKLSTGKGVGSKNDAGRQLMTTIIINSLFIHAVNSLMTAFVKGEGDDPEEEFINQLTDGKKVVAAMMTESFSGVPILGDGWRYGVNNAMGLKAYDSSSNPATKVAKAVSSAYSLMTDDKDRTASEMTDSILRVVQGFGSISPYTAVFSQGANVARDGLGFYNNTLGKGLTDDDSKQLSVDRITKKYSAIKKVDADAYKDADKLEKKQISSARHEAIEQYLLDYLMELPEERRKMVIEELKEKKSVPKDVMKRVEREVIH